MSYIQANGISLHFSIEGEGYPLVLIAGLGGDMTFWGTALKYFTPHFKVITFDCRGSGLSDSPDSPYSIELFADDLAALLTELKIETAHVLGFSMGGSVAQAFAIKYPQRVSRLVLAATFATLNAQARLFLDAVLAVYEGGCSPKQMFDLIAPWLFSESFLKKPENEASLHFDEADPHQQPFHAWKRQYLAQRAFDATGELHRIKSPTLIIAGEEDRLAHVNDSKILSDKITGSHLALMEGVGHLMNFEASDEFYHLVRRFLESPQNQVDWKRFPGGAHAKGDAARG